MRGQAVWDRDQGRLRLWQLLGLFQFCANDPEVFVQAALLAQDYCDAIDLNLGCPQMIAKRGEFRPGVLGWGKAPSPQGARESPGCG